MEETLEFLTFVGVPASGKSTLADKYRKMGYIILSSDERRAEIEEKINSGELTLPDNTNLNATVFESLKQDASTFLKEGKSVVFDATNLGRRRRMNFRKSLYKIKCKKTCVLFITTVDNCYERNSKREGYARVPDEAMYKMFCNFECPAYFEGWDEIIPIIDETPYTFDFEKIKDFPQDNPHHSLTLDKHIQTAYELAVKNNFSERVKKALAYHDVGKYFTKRFENSKGEKTEFAHFYGHENFGAYLYLTENCCGKNLTKEEFEEILYVTNLINCHMRPLTLWQRVPVVKEKDKKMFGQEFFEDLVNFNYCDRTAH